MLSNRWNSNKEEPIKIKDYSYDDFYQFLTFLYSGQCELNETNILSMVDIAEFYGVECFKKHCDDYLSALTISAANVFSMMELADKYSMVQLKASTHSFIVNNFQRVTASDEFLNFKKNVIEELILTLKDSVKPEDLFQAVFKWSEKQAIDKQTADSTAHYHDIIKNEMSNFLASIDFKKMELWFLHEFVVSRGFIFPSYNELSKILCDRYPKAKVNVTNVRGQTLHGILSPDNIFIEIIQSLKKSKSVDGYEKANWWQVKPKNPLHPCPLKKKDGTEWYLVYRYPEFIGIRHFTIIDEIDYLIAELTPGTSGFKAAPGCKIEIE